MKKIEIYVCCISFFLLYPVLTKADTVDNYQLFIRNKLVMNDSGFGSAKKVTNLLLLSKDQHNEMLSLYFNHCTSGAEKRKIVLVTHSKKNIREWNFKSKHVEAAMALPIGVLLDLLQVKHDLPLALYYYDAQLPDGRFLIQIDLKQ